MPSSRFPTACLATLAALLLLGATPPAVAQVGRTTVTLGGMPVTLSYPTEARSTPQRLGPFEIDVAPDAAPTAGVHRLVVISHGTAGSALADQALASALAEAGFVAAQPLHPGDTHLDASRAGPQAFRTRPNDVVRLLDALAANPAWRDTLDLTRVGVHGMSAGGVTALALAGAQWRTLSLLQHCQAHLEDDIGFCFNGALTPAQQAERRAGFEGARGVPEAYLPEGLTRWEGGTTPAAPGADLRPDVRIAAVTLAVPVGAIFSADSLARIRIPVGVLGAERDEVLVPAFHSAHVLAHCSACTDLGRLRGGGHFDVLSPWPAPVAHAVAAQQIRGGTPQPGFDPAERSAAVARIVDFHRRTLAAAP
ncbi:hypothetical protein V4F39_19995 [Aquincola sp. MAHUQ-54]|uniref:Dienelactone hydrolase n=1 Tax=Aquincola agrisoli TaxID=3119538 RepID=A0AAW9QH94_9BURK